MASVSNNVRMGVVRDWFLYTSVYGNQSSLRLAGRRLLPCLDTVQEKRYNDRRVKQNFKVS